MKCWHSFLLYPPFFQLSFCLKCVNSSRVFSCLVCSWNPPGWTPCCVENLHFDWCTLEVSTQLFKGITRKWHSKKACNNIFLGIFSKYPSYLIKQGQCGCDVTICCTDTLLAHIKIPLIYCTALQEWYLYNLTIRSHFVAVAPLASNQA